jgi:hypothetical protein
MIIMKKIRILAILAFVLFTLIGFYSCDKKPDEIKVELNGTEWEGEVEFGKGPSNEPYTYKGNISISFASDDADIVVKMKITHTYWDSWNYQWITDSYTETYKGTATYSCEEDKVTLKIKWKNDDVDDIDDGKWSGTFDQTKMTLKNVFGETVKFTK